MMNSAHRTTKVGLAYAFLLVSGGGACLVYSYLLWREAPQFDDAQIAQSVDINLALDLASEQKTIESVDPASITQRRQVIEQEIRTEIKSDYRPALIWSLIGIVIMMIGAVKYWITLRSSSSR